MMLTFIVYTILVLGMINIVRLSLFMVSADIYEVISARRHKRDRRLTPYYPKISIIIPAFNEEMGVIRTLDSVLTSSYKRKEIIVVNDGSRDRTLNMLIEYQLERNIPYLKIVHQENGGKAQAINNGLKNHASGSLVMVLDADSVLHPAAIANMVKHFRDKRVAAMAANVKVIDDDGLMVIAQRLEYVISYRMKRALTVLNMEYIIGGVGSTFRRTLVEACGYYDTDTLTEDIDFTVKMILKQGNKDYKVGFASDVLTYTEGVMTFKGLLRQRYRWKYGRMQTFYKNRNLFFSRQNKHSIQLSWLYLPYVVFSECMLLFDPIFTATLLYISMRYGGVDGLLSAYVTVSIFSVLNIISEDTEKVRSKLKLAVLAPIAYFLLLIMSTIDFLVLVQCLVKFPAIMQGKAKQGHWNHVERSGGAVVLP